MQRLSILRAIVSTVLLGVASACASGGVDLTPSISISPVSASLARGETRQLVASVTPVGSPVTWSSTAPAVATVSASGFVTAISSGATTIVAAANGISAAATLTVTPPAIQSITVTPAALAITPGQSVGLSVSIVGRDGAALSGMPLVWASNNPAVATVSSGGVVTGIAAGNATVSLSVENYQANVAVTVIPPAVASVSLSPSSVALLTGSSQQMTATLRDASGSTLTGRTVIWTSTNPAVATVSSSGVVIGNAPGNATINASVDNQAGLATITVLSPTVATVSLSATSVALTVGRTQQLSATPRDAVGNALGGRAVTWISSNPGVATVSGTGIITAVWLGNASISATIEGHTAVAGVAVTPPPQVPVARVTLSAISVSLTVGGTQQLFATPRDTAGNALSGRAVTWASTNPGVATVSSAGVITAVAPGNPSVTATIEGQSATAAVTVTNVPVASVMLSATSVSLTVGAAQQLAATPIDAAGNPLSGRVVTWMSNNPAVASVSGVGLMTAVGVGSAGITATIENRSATAIVSVTDPASAVASVSIVPAALTLTAGCSATVTADVRNGLGQAVSNPTVVWSSNAALVATVSQSGVVQTITPGSAQITATSQGHSGSASLTVQQAATTPGVPRC